MFYEIGKFLGLVKEEQTGWAKISSFLTTNWTGMIIGAIIAAAIIGIVYAVRKKRAKTIKKTLQDGWANTIVRLGSILGKLKRDKTTEVKRAA